jgi:predicted transcriptional regulator
MIPEEVRTFLRDYIDSYEGLEVLLLLRRVRTAWTTEALCARLKTSATLIDRTLATLVRARLVNSANQNVPTSYTYAEEDETRDAILCALDRAYREEPIEVIQLMSTNAIERLRTGAIRAFADAFILRKDKDRG